MLRSALRPWFATALLLIVGAACSPERDTDAGTKQSETPAIETTPAEAAPAPAPDGLAAASMTEADILAELTRSTQALLTTPRLPQELGQQLRRWGQLAKASSASDMEMFQDASLDATILSMCPDAAQIVEDAGEEWGDERGRHVFERCGFARLGVLDDGEGEDLQLPPIAIWALYQASLDAGIPPAQARSHVRTVLAAWDLHAYSLWVAPERVRVSSYDKDYHLPLAPYSMIRDEIQTMVSRTCWMQSQGGPGFAVTADDASKASAVLDLLTSSECELGVALTSTRRDALLEPRRAHFRVVPRAPEQAISLRLEAGAWTLGGERHTTALEPAGAARALRALAVKPGTNVAVSCAESLTAGALIGAVSAIQQDNKVEILVVHHPSSVSTGGTSE